MKLHPSILPLVLSLAAMPLAEAVTITFETDQGYFTNGGVGNNGNLKGQPAGTGGTGWTNVNDGARLRVADDGKGGQWLLANNDDGASNYYTFNPSAADLGEAFDPAQSQIHFSFDYTLIQRSTQTGIGYFRIGSTNGNVISMVFYTDGKINLNAGTSRFFAKAADGVTDFAAAANATYTISGILDYETKTYTLTINGVDQQFGGSESLGFVAPASPGVDLNIITINPTNALWRPYAIDNLTYEAIPEGGTVSMFGLAGGVAWLLNRRRKA